MKKIVLLLFLLLPIQVYALVCTSLGDGNWSNASTWSCGRVPLPTDQVIIAHDVILDQNVQLTYSTGTVGYSLVINAGASLVDNGSHTLQIGQNSGTGYNGFNIAGDLDVYNLILEKADDPQSVLQSTGNITVRCTFENINRGDLVVNGFMNIQGDWHVGNGNTDTSGGGFVLVAGCLNTSGGGQTGNITVDFCVVQPAVDCLCYNGGSNSGAVSNPNGQGQNGQGTTGGSEAECLAILPVSYVSFSGKVKEGDAINNTEVILEWKTATEFSHDHFVIERSFEGKAFEQIGEVKAKGAKNTLTVYLFADTNIIESGQVYYRLKEVSSTGDISYSPVLAFKIKKSSIFTLYPNPAKQGRSVFIATDEIINHILLQNHNGVVLAEYGNINASETDLVIPIALPKGLYMLKLTTINGICYKRIVVE